MNIRLTACILLLCFALPVTAAKRTLPATPIQTSQPAEIVFTQQELAVEVPNTANAAGMQFGLIGALIGTAVTNAQVKNAEQRVGELRNSLLGYPFNDRMEAALREKLAANGVLGDQGLKVLHTTWDANAASTSATTEDVLLLVPRYTILSSFEQLSVTLTLDLAQRSAIPGKKARQKSLFSRTYAFLFPLSEIDGGGPDEDAARWMAFDASTLPMLLDTGIDQVTDMLVYDLSTEGRSEAELPNKRMSGSVGDKQFSGRVVRSGEGWVWVRVGNGTLKTLVGHHPVDSEIVAGMVARAGTAALDNNPSQTPSSDVAPESPEAETDESESGPDPVAEPPATMPVEETSPP